MGYVGVDVGLSVALTAVVVWVVFEVLVEFVELRTIWLLSVFVVQPAAAITPMSMTATRIIAIFLMVHPFILLTIG